LLNQPAKLEREEGRYKIAKKNIDGVAVREKK
jgi:hypothetical protein